MRTRRGAADNANFWSKYWSSATTDLKHLCSHARAFAYGLIESRPHTGHIFGVDIGAQRMPQRNTLAVRKRQNVPALMARVGALTRVRAASAPVREPQTDFYGAARTDCLIRLLSKNDKGPGTGPGPYLQAVNCSGGRTNAHRRAIIAPRCLL